MTRADLDKAPGDVAAMFDDVAERYDLTNDVLAVGQTRRWRTAVVDAVAPSRGSGSSTWRPARARRASRSPRPGPSSCRRDFSLGMLRVGKRRQPYLPFVAGDGMHLPFRDAAFDAATISFGLRNIHDRMAGLRELLRVVRPGGRLVVCEFSHPTWAPFRTVYTEYLMKALPAVARRTSSNPDAYVYLAESIRAWPDQESWRRTSSGRVGTGAVAEPERRHRDAASRGARGANAVSTAAGAPADRAVREERTQWSTAAGAPCGSRGAPAGFGRGVNPAAAAHYAFVGREVIHKCANREEMRA